MNPAIFGVKPVGLSWTKNQITTSGVTEFYDISYNGTAYIIVGNFRTIYSTTTLGSSWTLRSVPSGPDSNTKFFCSANNGARFSVVGWSSTGSTGYALYSDNNGVTWSLGTIPNGSWTGVCYGGGQFVAVADGNIGGSSCATSTDGITWTSRVLPASFWQDVWYDNGVYASASLRRAISTSSDGVTWTSRTLTGTYNLNRVRYKAGVWVAAGGTSGGASSIALSYDNGATWAAQTVTGRELNGLCAHKNWFLANANANIGDPPDILRSISGISATWADIGSNAVPPSSNLLGCRMFAIISDGTNIIASYNDSNPSGDHGVLISS